MDPDGIEPPHRDFQSLALPFELQVHIETRVGFEPTITELQSAAFPAWLPCLNYGTWNRTKITGTKILWATITPCRIEQP